MNPIKRLRSWLLWRRLRREIKKALGDVEIVSIERVPDPTPTPLSYVDEKRVRELEDQGVIAVQQGFPQWPN